MSAAEQLAPTPRRKGGAKYDFRPAPGSRIKKADARIIGRRLRELERKHGSITAEIVAEDAKNFRSPLHRFFEWDDRAAAYEYRLTQARHILRSVTIVVLDSKGKETQVRAFHAMMTENPGERRYVALDVVTSSPDYTAQMIANAKREFMEWTARYEKYSFLSRQVKQIKAAFKKAMR